MKKQYLVILFILSFSSCFSEKPISEKVISTVLNRKYSIKDQLPALIGDQYHQNVIEVITGDPINLYIKKEFDNPEIITKLNSNVEILLVGKCEDFYLVKDKKSTRIWDGWIKKSDLNIKLKDDELLNELSQFLISRDNQYLGFVQPVRNKVEVINQKGEIVISARQERGLSTYEGIRILNWSEDSQYLWSVSSFEGTIISFMKIEIKSGIVEIFESPGKLKGLDFQINYDANQILYTDFPFQFTQENALMTKEENKEFKLYLTDLKFGNTKEIANCFGQGFSLVRISYKKVQYSDSSGTHFYQFK